MPAKELTDAELLLLGLVAEMPRHGYELDQVIEERGMREWTQIGFSSIYFVLGKLEKHGLVSAGSAKKSRLSTKSKKQYKLTAAGRKALVNQTLSALREVRPTYSSALLGMINWDALEKNEALAALHARKQSIDVEIKRLSEIQFAQQPLPDYVEVLFEHSLGQLKAESEWVTRTWEYMSNKPWLE